MQIDVISDVVCPWWLHRQASPRIRARRMAQGTSRRRATRGALAPLPSSIRYCPAAACRAPNTLRQSSAVRSVRRKSTPGSRMPGARAGIAFNFDGITVQPNTLNAHRLIHPCRLRRQAGCDGGGRCSGPISSMALICRATTRSPISRACRLRPQRDQRLSGRRRGQGTHRGPGSACAVARRRRRAFLHFQPAPCRLRCAAARVHPRRNGESAGRACCGRRNKRSDYC